MVRDVTAPNLDVLFCGINPGIRSAQVGHHFAHPSNRFWKALYISGFTPQLLASAEERRLLGYGIGVTNLVSRATPSASLLGREELHNGVRVLGAKVRRLRPRMVAVLGLGAYRVGFDRPRAGLGEQTAHLGASRLWLLPNPSGAEGRYGLDRLVEELRAMRRSLDLQAPLGAPPDTGQRAERSRLRP
jgi:double-stranded uracil-DNA glycosylase